MVCHSAQPRSRRRSKSVRRSHAGSALQGPPLPDAVAREAYSQEVSSARFWPGGGAIDHAAFYAYAYPVPEGFSDDPVQPDAAHFPRQLREFLLPYDVVRTAENPNATVLAFLQSTHEAAAVTAGLGSRSPGTRSAATPLG